MKKNMKTLSAAALALTCVLGGCGNKAKTIDFEENYTKAQTAALSIVDVEESTEGFFMSMEMDMVMKAKVEGMDMEITMEMDIFVNHVGDNYYMESYTAMFGVENTIGAAIEKQADGSYNTYSWMNDYMSETGGMVYYKQNIPASELEEFDDLIDIEEANFGIQEIFEGGFSTVETAMREAIVELMEEDTFSDLPITIGNLEDLVITKKATEKDGKQTFKVTAELPSEVEGEELSITFGIVVDGETVDSLLMNMKGKGTSEGTTIAYDADVKQKIEAKGNTKAKYSSIPQNVTWIEE